MDKLKLLNNQLYEYLYIPPNPYPHKVATYHDGILSTSIQEDLGNVRDTSRIDLWNSITEDKELLKEAIKVTKNKWNEDTVCASTICDMLLMDFQNVDCDIYQELINTIYSNRRIARICLDDAVSSSFLLMSLWNFDLKLTEEQKAFAVSEAMNMLGTTEEDTNKEFTNVHGSGYFDIGYWILRNSNWTLEEKQKLVMECWDNDDDYDERLEQWEWSVVNDPVNYQGNMFPPFDRYDLFYTPDYGYDYLLDYHKDKETTDRLWEEIEFCKMMHQLRPMQFETSSVDIHTQITVTNGNESRMKEIEKVLERIAKMLDFSVSLESSTSDSMTVSYQKKFPLK